jgi:hypothetical protein
MLLLQVVNSCSAEVSQAACLTCTYVLSSHTATDNTAAVHHVVLLSGAACVFVASVITSLLLESALTSHHI